MKKYTKGMVEVGEKLLERTIYADGERFYIRLVGRILEIKNYEDDIWYLV